MSIKSKAPVLVRILQLITMPWSNEARLAYAETRRIPPAGVDKPPVVLPNASALKVYARIARKDADSAGTAAPSGSGSRIQPSVRIVRAWSRAPLDRLGQRAQLVMSEHAAGTLGRALPKRVSSWRVACSLWPLLTVLTTTVVAGGLVEVAYGRHAAALLTAATPGLVLTAAIAFSLVLNGGAFIAAGWLHRSHPTIVRRRGTSAFCLVLLMVAATTMVLGLVVGGFDAMNLSNVSGGGPGATAIPRPDTRPLLSAAYFLVVFMVSIAIAAGHLLFAHSFETRMAVAKAEALHRAQRDTVPVAQRLSLAIALARAHVAAIEFCHAEGARRVDTYNATFRQLCSEDVAASFDDIAYDAAEPLWVSPVMSFIDDLEAERDEVRQLRLIG